MNKVLVYYKMIYLLFVLGVGDEVVGWVGVCDVVVGFVGDGNVCCCVCGWCVVWEDVGWFWLVFVWVGCLVILWFCNVVVMFLIFDWYCFIGFK